MKEGRGHVIVRRHAPNDPVLLPTEVLEALWMILDASDFTVRECWISLDPDHEEPTPGDPN